MDVNESFAIPASASPKEAGRRWVWFAAAGVGVLVVILGVRLAAGGPKAATGLRAVPVSTAPVQAGDMPLKLTGLGTVVPTDAVVVRTRVDGQIDRIAFREGQLVRQGDLLLDYSKNRIDGDTMGLLDISRPFARGSGDARLALEVGVIQALAEDLCKGLMVRDPLSQSVHHGKVRMGAIALGAMLRTSLARLGKRR